MLATMLKLFQFLDGKPCRQILKMYRMREADKFRRFAIDELLPTRKNGTGAVLVDGDVGLVLCVFRASRRGSYFLPVSGQGLPSAVED